MQELEYAKLKYVRIKNETTKYPRIQEFKYARISIFTGQVCGSSSMQEIKYMKIRMQQSKYAKLQKCKNQVCKIIYE